MTEKVQGPVADPADVQKIRETCELLLSYHDPGDYRRKRHHLPCARFLLIHVEALDRLTAVCIEYGYVGLWQRAIEELNTSFCREVHVDLTVGAIGRLLYQTQETEHLKKADYLIKL